MSSTAGELLAAEARRSLRLQLWVMSVSANRAIEMLAAIPTSMAVTPLRCRVIKAPIEAMLSTRLAMRVRRAFMISP